MGIAPGPHSQPQLKTRDAAAPLRARTPPVAFILPTPEASEVQAVKSA